MSTGSLQTQGNNKDHYELIKLKANVVDAIRNEMKKINAIECYYNKITQGTGACEQTATAFVLANTKELSFMSQTDQLLMESDVVEHNLEAVWTIGRSYRNEPKAGDGRHLSEFALLEFEAQHMDLHGLLKFQQKLLNNVIEVALHSDLISKEHKTQLQKYQQTPAMVIDYTEVIGQLNKKHGMNIQWGEDFTSAIEEKICTIFDGPVQTTHYPESIKFFNMYRTERQPLEPNMSIEEYNARKYTVECVDFLLPAAGETFGASQREEIHSTLVTKLRESRMMSQMAEVRAQYLNQPKVTSEIFEDAYKPFVPYLDLFRSGKKVMRSGFGLGMGRLIQFLVKSPNVIQF